MLSATQAHASWKIVRTLGGHFHLSKMGAPPLRKVILPERLIIEALPPEVRIRA